MELASWCVYVRGDLNIKEQEKLFTKMKAATSKEMRKKIFLNFFFFWNWQVFCREQEVIYIPETSIK